MKKAEKKVIKRWLVNGKPNHKVWASSRTEAAKLVNLSEELLTCCKKTDTTVKYDYAVSTTHGWYQFIGSQQEIVDYAQLNYGESFLELYDNMGVCIKL
ncbi:MAG: hypothetical protein AAGI23_09320 [Bacteroidota bacterium]